MFRVARGGVTRYYLVDYKTLWVGDDGELSANRTHLGHYLPQSLRSVMNTHLYHLQSHLYQVAINRLLRQRLGDVYQPQLHFGGALYLFLRGMAGEASRVVINGVDHGSAGVYIHRPPHRVTELLSLALENPSRAEQALSDLFEGLSRMKQRSSEWGV